MNIDMPLAGLRITVAGQSRALFVAARWYADLGASVQLTRPSRLDPVEAAWLGTYLAGQGPTDVCLTNGEATVPARTTVVLTGTGARAKRAHERARHGA